MVKTSRPGVKLNYRRGYFALDTAGLAKTQNREDQLHDACARLLPSAAIGLTATLAPDAGNRAGSLAYQISISSNGVTFLSAWTLPWLAARLARRAAPTASASKVSRLLWRVMCREAGSRRESLTLWCAGPCRYPTDSASGAGRSHGIGGRLGCPRAATGSATGRGATAQPLPVEKQLTQTKRPVTSKPSGSSYERV